MNTFKMAKVFYRCAKVVIFRQIWSHWPWTTGRRCRGGFERWRFAGAAWSAERLWRVWGSRRRPSSWRRWCCRRPWWSRKCSKNLWSSSETRLKIVFLIDLASTVLYGAASAWGRRSNQRNLLNKFLCERGRVFVCLFLNKFSTQAVWMGQRVSEG